MTIGQPVLLLGGLSGTGKSTVSQWIAEDLKFLHYEIDVAGADGIDSNRLRTEWNEFYSRGNGAPFSALLRDRTVREGKRGAVLSFPSNAVFTDVHMSAARVSEMQILILVGTVDRCLNAFLERERATGRGFDSQRWHRFNDDASALYSRASYEPIRVEAFQPDGSRFTGNEMVALVRGRLAG